MSDSFSLSAAHSTVASSDFAKEDWEKWMNFDGPFDALTPQTNHSGSPPPLQFVSGSLGSTSPSELESLPPLQFSPVYALPTTESKKRKSSAIAEGNGTATNGRQPRGKKISHNVIEKRYRSNLNDKIAKLRDSVPELRSAQPTVKRRPQKPVPSDSDASGDENGNQGLKFNKATVLVKATEYIQQLERQNQRLLAEVSTLRTRYGSAPKAVNTPVISTGFSVTGRQQTALPKPTIQIENQPLELADEIKEEISPSGLIPVPDDIRRLRDEVPPQPHYAPEATTSGSDASVVIPPFSEIKGMIPLSESWQRFRAQGRSEEHYAPPSSSAPRLLDLQEPSLDDDDEGSRWSRSRMMSRVLVGSLAGLMIMEGFSEKEEEGQKLDKRGLFSLPNELLTESRGFRDPIRRRIIAFAASPNARRAVPIVCFSFIFLAIFFAVFVYITPTGSRAMREGSKQEKSQERNLSQAGSAGPVSQNSIGLRVDAGSSQDSATSGQAFVLKVLQWLRLSWLVAYHHDEEAASGLNAESHSRDRWTRILHSRFLENVQNV
jgi:hypothetical protein